MTDQPKYRLQVEVKSEYLAEHSEPEMERFVFAYHIKITNTGNMATKLVSRHWLITDGNEQIEEVKGPGVVGEQPEIEPQESYEYTSGAILKTPIGTMQGSYQMLAADGVRFEAPIPTFALAVKEQLH